MFENMNMEGILAILGFIIASLQFTAEIRVQSEEWRKRKLVSKMTDGCTEISEALERILDAYSQIQKDSWEMLVVHAEEILNTCCNTQSIVKKMYVVLLQTEDAFSLSYGYDRFIEAFRTYLNNDKDRERFTKLVSEMKAVNEGMKKVQEEVGVLVTNDTYSLEQRRKEVCNLALLESDRVEKLRQYTDEMRIRYGRRKKNAGYRK